MNPMEHDAILPDDLLDHRVVGLNLRGSTLRDQLGTDPTLILFLRHLG